MIGENPNSEKFTQRILFGFCGPNALFHTCGKKFLTLKFIAKNDLLYFLTSSDVRKGFPHISPAHLQFPHILHVWNWLQQISSHFSTQSSELENRQTKNSSHFSNVWNFGKRSFPYINSTHVENSSVFPHIFLTLKFHRHANPHIFNCKEIEYSHYQRPSKKKKKNPHNNPEQVAIIPHIFQCEKSFLHIFQCEERISSHFPM